MVFAPRSTPRAQELKLFKPTWKNSFVSFVVKKVFAVQSSVQSVASSLRLRFLKEQGRFFSVCFAL